MNGTYRLVWHRVRGAWLLLPALAAANPEGGRVVTGQATIHGGAGNLVVRQQSQRAVVDWRSFSIGAGETARFDLPSARSAILNRVTGGDPSKLHGRLSSNGTVFLLNPNGVLVGPSGVIDTGAFAASTLRLSNDAFMAGGDLRFEGESLAGVSNLGLIRAAAGDVTLLAHTVANAGRIEAPAGAARLGAGTSILLKAAGEDRLYVAARAATAQAARGVDNSGVVEAAQAELKAAGSVYALAVNQSGLVRATGVQEGGGRIVLTAEGGNVQMDGTLAARRADGSGGEVLVGGGWRGKDGAVPHATSVTVGSQALIDVAGGAGRDGGRSVVWSDGATRFAGRFDATGERGGDAEVSGRQLAMTGRADLRGRGGDHGTLLLDPATLNVVAGTAPNDGVNSNVGANWVTDQLGFGDLLLDATDTLNVQSAVTWAGPTRLTLQAPTVNLDAAVSGFSQFSRLQVLADRAHLNAAVSAGDVTFRFLNTLQQLTASAQGAITAQNALYLNGVASAQLDAARVTAPEVRFQGTSAQDLRLGNAANQIGSVDFNGGEATAVFSGDLDIASARDLALKGRATAATATVKTAANLRLDADARLESAGRKLLVAQGQFVNAAGSGAFAGAGRNMVYSRSEETYGGVAFNAGGLAFAQHPGSVKFPADPAGAGDVFYFAGLPLTVRPWSLSRYYGTADPAFGFEATGLASGDTLAGVFLATNALAGSNVGNYMIAASGGTSALGKRYDITYVNGTLAVVPMPLQVSVANASRLYGDANVLQFTPGFFAGTLLPGIAVPDGGHIVYQGAPGATAAVGSYPISLAFAAPFSGNFTVSHNAATMSVLPAPLTLRASSGSMTYLDGIPFFSVGITGMRNGESLASTGILGAAAGVGARSLRYATQADAGAGPVDPGVGTYAVGRFVVATADGTAATLNPNYYLRIEPGELQVTPRPLTVVLPSLAFREGARWPTELAPRTAAVLNAYPATCQAAPGQVCAVRTGLDEYLESYVSGHRVAAFNTLAGNGWSAGSMWDYGLRDVVLANPNYVIGRFDRSQARITILPRVSNEELLATGLQTIRYDLVDPFKLAYNGSGFGVDDSSFNRYIFSDGSLDMQADGRGTLGLLGLFGQQGDSTATNIFGLTHKSDAALMAAFSAFCWDNADVCGSQGGMTGDVVRTLYGRMMGDMELRGRFLPYLTAETVRIAKANPRTPSEQALLDETSAFIRRTQENNIRGVINEIAAYLDQRDAAEAWKKDINSMMNAGDMGKPLPADLVKKWIGQLVGVPASGGSYDAVMSGTAKLAGTAASLVAGGGGTAGLLATGGARGVLSAIYPHMFRATDAFTVGGAFARIGGPIAAVAQGVALIAEAAAGFDRQRKLSEAIRDANDAITGLSDVDNLVKGTTRMADGSLLDASGGQAMLMQFQAMMLAQR